MLVGFEPAPGTQPAAPARGIGDLLKIDPLLLVVLVGFVVAYRFVDPAPPDRIVLATGEAGGAYATFGEAYRRRLRPDVEVVLRETAESRIWACSSERSTRPSCRARRPT